MGSIFQDKAGRWRGVVNLPKGKDGIRKQKVFYGDPNQTPGQQKRVLQAKTQNWNMKLTITYILMKPMIRWSNISKNG